MLLKHLIKDLYMHREECACQFKSLDLINEKLYNLLNNE